MDPSTVERGAASSILELPFTGRASELGSLQGQIDKIRGSGKGAVALVLGEAGMGKTRLIRRFRELAAPGTQGLLWLGSSCARADDITPYSPWVEFLRDFVNQASVRLFFKACGPDVEQIIRLVPELSEDKGKSSATGPPSSPEDEVKQKLLFYQSLTQFFGRLAEESPLVLFFDDFQWADPATTQLIAFFKAGVLKTRPILLLVACRDFEAMSDRNQAVVNLLKDWEGERETSTVKLGKFDEPTVEELLIHASKRNAVSKEFTNLIHSKTGGNPLFINEVLKSLLERHDITVNESGQWDQKPISEIVIPSTVVEVIRRRLDRLDSGSREVLRAASVIGDSFDIKVLSGVVEGDIDPVLSIALSSGLVERRDRIRGGLGGSAASRPGDKGLFVFSDESVRDVLYSELEASPLKAIHKKIGRVMEALESGSLEEVAGELAFHFLGGGEPTKALEYGMKAADRARSLFAHEEAAFYSKFSLDALETRGQEDLELLRARLLEQLGDETSLYKGGDAGLADLEEAARIYARFDRASTAGAAYNKIGNAYQVTLHDRDTALRFFEKAIEMLKTLPPSHDLARNYISVGIIHSWDDRIRLAKEAFRKADEMARDIQDEVVASQVAYTGLYVAPIGDLDNLIARCNSTLDRLLTKNLPWEVAQCYLHRSFALSRGKGASPDVLRLSLEGEAYTSKIQNFALNFWQRAQLVVDLYLPLGRWEEASGMIEWFNETIQRLPKNSSLELLADVASAILLQYRGDLEESERRFRRVQSGGSGFGNMFVITPYIYLGKIFLQKGDYVQARTQLGEARARFRKSYPDGPTVLVAMQLSQTLAELVELETKAKDGSLREAETYLSELRRAAHDASQDWARAYLHRAEGILFSNQLDFASARESLLESARLWEEMGWPYELATTLHQLALTYFRAGDEGRATECNSRSLDLFRSLGAEFDVGKAKDLAKRLKTLHEAPMAGPKQRALFDYLTDAFLEDNTTKSMSPESSGWRTLGEMAEHSGVPKSTLYRLGPRSEPVIKELLSARMIESKIFSGSRGRGGEVTRYRINRDVEYVEECLLRLAQLKTEKIR